MYNLRMNENINRIKRLGIYLADRLTARMPNLLFRAQREGSTGLNAHLEIVSENNNLGRVVGLKICTVDECEKSARGYVCIGEMTAAAYWLQHSLPVIVMIYDKEYDKILWEEITPDTLEVSGKKWELVVPYENEYGTEESAGKIANLTCTSPYLARLALDKAWIELIYEGREIFLELDEWINQPNSRGSLRLCVNGSDGGIYQWPFQTSPDMPHVMRLPSLFPWAFMKVDEEFYREKGINNIEPEVLAPYVIESGEIARFRFKLSLNELGRAFLTAEPYICRGHFPDTGHSAGYGAEYESGLKFMLYDK